MPAETDRRFSVLREIDTALATDGSRLKLSEPLRRRIDDDNWRTRAQAMRAYFFSMSALVFLTVPLDFSLMPHAWLLAVCLQLGTAFGVHLPTALLFRRRVSPLAEAVVPCVAVFLQVVLTFYLGAHVEEPRAQLHRLAYYISAMFLIYAALITLRLDQRAAVLLAGACLALFTGFLLQEPDVPLGEIACLLSFYGLCLAVAMGRRVGFDRAARRAELLALRDDLRLDELAASNARLLDISNTDSLTGVANRRFFTDAMETLWQDAMARRRTLGVILLDVDHFKALNDTYGHAEGDRCLQLIARAIADAARVSGDMVARFGGEEFIVLLPDTDTSAAVQIAERLRVAVAAISLAASGPLGRPSPRGVTVSLGVAAAIPLPGSLAATLIAAADRALYAAKAAGRDCVRAADDLPATPMSAIPYGPHSAAAFPGIAVLASVGR